MPSAPGHAPVTRPAAALAVAALLGLGACGGPVEAETTAAGLRRLALTPSGSHEHAQRVVLHRTAGDQAGDWKQREGRAPKLVTVDGRAAVRLDLDQPDSAWVRADVRSAAFDGLRVTLRIPEGATELVRAGLHQGADTLLVSEMQQVVGTGAPRPVTFPLAGIERLDVDVEQVSVQVAARAPWAEVLDVTLLRSRPAARFPAPGEPPRLVDHGPQARRGWGLDARTPATVEIPGGLPLGTRLHLALAAHPGGEGRRLVLHRADGVERSVDLRSERHEWRSVWVTDPPPGPLRLSLAGEELEARGAWTAVAEVQLLEPRTRPAPLVLLVTSDTHRADHVDLGSGALPGSALVHTPALARLASRGTTFVDALAPSNMTNPSHSAILSGLSPRDTRIVGNRAPLADDAVTVAERFAAAGYRTAAAVSAQHIGHAYSGLGQGFDRYDGMEERSDYRFTKRDGAVAVERALGWIEESPDVPLFLWVHLFDAHSPYQAPDPFVAPYRAEDGRPIPAALDPVPRGEVPAWIRDDPDLTRDVLDAHARYRAAIDRLDRVIEPLLEHPRAVSGVTVFTGDHGEAFGRNGLWWTHHGLYTDQLDVPLIVAAPGLPMPPGWLSSAPVSAMGVGGTLLQLAGLDPAPHPAPPLPLEPLPDGAPPEPRFALGYAGLKAAIEHEGWLLILNLQDHEEERGPRSFRKGARELYHLTDDRACALELAAREPERADRLERALVRWLAQADPVGLAGSFNVSAEAQRRLVELGYAGNLESTRAGAWYRPDVR